MNSGSIDLRIRTVVSQMLHVPIDEISDESGPDSIANWDSIAHLSLVMALESEFDISFQAEDVTDMLSVGLIKMVLSDLGVVDVVEK